jgi:hypothetical protein
MVARALVEQLLETQERLILEQAAAEEVSLLVVITAALVLSSSSAINKVNDELSWSNNY